MVNSLEVIKAFIFNQNEAGWIENTLSNADMKWLIEQAEQLDKIKKLSKTNDLPLSTFAIETLRIIEGREESFRNKRI